MKSFAKATAAVVLAATATLAPAVSASAHNIGTEGCTPGYWKNHTNNWNEGPRVTYDASTLTLEKAGFVVSDSFQGDLLRDALSYRGGAGVDGAEQILLRAAAAAWLNAAHEGVGYPYRRFGGEMPIVSTVNAVIASGDRAAMLDLAATLDAANNLGCPLNNTVWGA